MTKQLRDWMQAHHMSQTQLANRMGVTQAYISSILSGNRIITPGFIGRFAQAFGFDVAAEVFGGAGGKGNGDDVQSDVAERPAVCELCA